MKKVRAGGAVDYYLNQVRSGMADYYLGGTGQMTPGQKEQLLAPGSAWRGGGATELSLAGAVGDTQFVDLFDKAQHPDGSGKHLGRAYRQPKDAKTIAKAVAAAAEEDDDAYRRWMTKYELKRKGPHEVHWF